MAQENNGVRLIDGELISAVVDQARQSARGRKNYNFHADEGHPVNRLLNAVEPGSYIRPHRHLDPAKDETFVVVRGRFGLVLFDEAGRVVQTALLAAGGAAIGADVPHGSYHTLISLEPGSVFFEAKAGPFRPIDDRERAPWAPAEGDPQAAAYLAELERRFR
jgi:cupin fold WbuC family metalloprotein